MNLHSKNNASQITGQKGEEQAAFFLTAANYKILDINWHYRKFEIDIIAEYDNKLIIVEVKTRSTNLFGNPESFVSLKKQQFLIAAANAYAEKKQLDKEIRFDIVSVLFHNNQFTIEHIPDAFYPRL
jgi:putative endonuclease